MLLRNRMIAWLLISTSIVYCVSLTHGDDSAKKNIVIIAGKKSHGPEGNGIHDYPWSAKLLKVMLDNSNIAEQVNVSYFRDGWPEKLDVLEKADTIMVISDGRDGDLFEEAPHIQTEERIAFMRRRMKEGCGLITFHFSTFAPDRLSREVLDWTGGYFDWADDQGRRKWYSAIKVQNTDLEIASPEHPALRGVKPFRMNEEFYYDIRFAENDKGLTPLLNVPTLEGRADKGNIVAWARQREDGGRGFGTTCGHFYKNWEHDNFRRMMLNALAWTAHVDVPKEGVNARFFSHDEITAALSDIDQGESTRALVDDQPINVLIVTGNEAHKWHNWEKSTPRVKASIEQDPRIRAEVIFSFDELGQRDLAGFDVLILNNFCNWHDPAPPSDDAKAAFLGFLKRGGGLAVIHFANGAFHHSLPEAGASDWPDYREIVRRRWNHTGPAAERSGHDPFQDFEVRPTDKADPLTEGMNAFQIVDELYFKQHGEKPIEPLLVARSEVTGEDEPLAWRYMYGNARVFQTVLGHSEQTWDAAEMREILRRAVAWAADRPIIKKDPASTAAPWKQAVKVVAPSLPKAFGKALTTPIAVKSNDALRDPPMTVECFARLNSKNTFNVLLASDTKASSRHWELYSFSQSGQFSVYFPGATTPDIRTDIDITDGKWHYLAMQFERDRVRLYVDGVIAKDQKLTWKSASHVDGEFALGRIVEGQFAIDGAMDNVRISRGVRPIDGVPDKPLERDDKTIALWNFDGSDDDDAEAVSMKEPPRKIAGGNQEVLPPSEGLEGGKFGHWGKKDDKDWKDARWNDMNIGPFFSAAIDVPGGAVTRGLAVRLGDEGQGTLLYDTADMTCRAAWTGAFIRFSPTRFGLIDHPQAAGDVQFTNLGKNPSAGQYKGLHVHGRRVLLDYLINGRSVSESPWIESVDEARWITRTVQVAAGEKAFSITMLEIDGNRTTSGRDGDRSWMAWNDGDDASLMVVLGGNNTSLDVSDGFGRCIVSASKESQTFKLAVWSGPADQVQKVQRALSDIQPARSLAELRQAGSKRWGQPIITKGEVANGDAMFLIDTITVPYENRFNALMFLSGVDFFSNGDAAVSTIHGDVWLVRGIDDDLDEITWQRFATGMFQPLGLAIRDDKVFVRCRDQITRLHDHNGDGEADEFECFSQLVSTTAGGHDYVTELQQDREGNFYYADPRGVHRISADGKKKHTLATGFRNPNGMGVGPDGTVTVAPQEGEWTPASMIHEIKDGGYYGFGGPQVTPERPRGYDLPMVYLPRLVDNSSGSQVWVTSDTWGPLAGQMLHLSYGRSSMQLILRDHVRGQPQGAAVPIEGRFLSGVHRGTFRRNDGQLYVVGTQGWVTNAIMDGCFQRVRYNADVMTLPIGLQAHENGVRIDFAVPLNLDIAADVGSYAAEQWNYKYAQSYGSKEYSARYKDVEGHDKVEIKAAYLSDDGRSVFLEIPGIQPVDQLDISGTLETVKGIFVPLQVYATIHALRPAVDTRNLQQMRPQDAPVDGAGESPGLVMSIKDANDQVIDSRVSRMAAIYVPKDQSPSVFTDPGPYKISWTGNLDLDKRSSRQFHIEGRGRVEVFIDGKRVLMAAGDELDGTTSQWITLAKGKRPIRITYEPAKVGDAAFRLFWRGRDFMAEPVPPTTFTHDENDRTLQSGEALRHGRMAVAERGCLNCHQPEGGNANWASAMPELLERPATLKKVGERLNEQWMISWLLEPQASRPNHRMPHMLAGSRFANDDSRAQAAADIAAFLVQGSSTNKAEAVPQFKDETIESGRSLFAALACVACHTLPSSETTEDQHGRVPLRHASAKWKYEALVNYLVDPGAFAPGTRMPNFALSKQQAEEIAAYLLSASAPHRAKPGSLHGDPESGREFVAELGCANCHEMDVESTLSAPSFEQLVERKAVDSGCLASPASGRAPGFGFSRKDTANIAEFLDRHASSLQRVNSAEYATRQMTAMRCINCHSRDGQSSVWDTVKPEVSAWLPDVASHDEEVDDYDSTDLDKKPAFKQQQWPSLTHAGDQLHADWMADFIGGRTQQRPRPWLYTRMPAFASRAESIAAGLSHQHGRSTVRPSPPAPSEELIVIGRKLFGAENGLSCVQCHAAGPKPALMDHEFGVIDLSISRERLRRDFYLRWALDPQRISPQTPMPDFADAEGRTPLREHFEGDAVKQFDAIWAYLHAAARLKEEEPAGASKSD